MKPRKKCMKLEEVLELVLDSSNYDDDDDESSESSDLSSIIENDSIKMQLVSLDVKRKPYENNMVNRELVAKDTSFKSDIIDDKNKNVEDKFHLKNLFHFIDKIEFKIPEKNELLVIYDTSDDDERKELKTTDKNNKNLLKSPVIELMYPLMAGTSQVISKKRKRKT
jgi:hypothetical protein